MPSNDLLLLRISPGEVGEAEVGKEDVEDVKAVLLLLDGRHHNQVEHHAVESSSIPRSALFK